MGCMQDIYTYQQGALGFPGDVFLSPKNESECLAVGGSPTPYYNWVHGTWHEGGRWQELNWKTRQWTSFPNKRLIDDFSSSAYLDLSRAGQVSLKGSQFQSDQYCR